jgi:3-deoxy-7-phosphoheptulonate synthase
MFPVGAAVTESIEAHRRAIRAVMSGQDDRVTVVIGPCSIHDTYGALEYAQRLAGAAARFADDLLIVARTYLEKPRTVLGWKGLLHDPRLDGGQDLVTGLWSGREFLSRVAGIGLPMAYEFVDPMLAPFVSDLMSWGAIGARTVASQPHRQLASSLPFPVGMKNTVGGDVCLAADSVFAAAAGHAFPGLSPAGEPSILTSRGNPWCHVVLRGGAVPNYDAASVSAAVEVLRTRGAPTRLMVDAAHGNSGKDHRRQPIVVTDLAEQISAGRTELFGVMIESYLKPGRQDISSRLRYGVSVTDACIGWDDSLCCLAVLARAVRARRRVRGNNH